MTTNTIEAFYLGVMADLDPDETNVTTENSASLIGTVVGGPSDQLYKRIDSLTLDDANSDGAVMSNDNGQTAENLIYGGVPSALDFVDRFDVTITYNDGSTATTRMLVMQDELGRVFLTPRQSGNTDNDPLDDRGIESIRFDAVDNNFIGSWTDLESDAFVICFAKGVRIAGSSGAVAVEDLRVGDLVQTLEHGAQPVVWVGRSRAPPSPAVDPIVFAPGSLDRARKLPARAMAVSPQHRLLIRSRIAERMTGQRDVLVPALACLELDGVSQPPASAPVEYVHVMLSRHEILFAEGYPVESFLTGPMLQAAWAQLHPSDRADLLARFPARAFGVLSMEPARPIMGTRRARHLIARHCKNDVPLFTPCARVGTQMAPA